jgi:uncharacterized protein (TIGR03084 family)
MTVPMVTSITVVERRRRAPKRSRRAVEARSKRGRDARIGYTLSMDVSEVLADLVTEQQALDDIVADLDAGQWTLATPSAGWNVADQIGHLTYFDRNAALAITDPDAFQQAMHALLGSDGNDGTSADGTTLGAYRALSPDELLVAWRSGRDELAAAATKLDNASRIAWYGPSMGSKSFLTARLMEVWAHGQDIVDAVGASRTPTERLRHIAQLGFITRGWTYVNRGLEVPSTPVRVEVESPSGAVWSFGPDDAPESISGPALDFCLVTTQRRHVDDTALVVAGSSARDWMEKAQLFAGPPTDGPRPRAA